jgi:hypothetical protein
MEATRAKDLKTRKIVKIQGLEFDLNLKFYTWNLVSQPVCPTSQLVFNLNFKFQKMMNENQFYQLGGRFFLMTQLSDLPIIKISQISWQEYMAALWLENHERRHASRSRPHD